MGKKDIGKVVGSPVTCQTPSPAGGVQMETFIPWTLVKRGVRRKVITPFDSPIEFIDEAASETKQREFERPSPLLRALGLAHHWQRLLDDGRFGSLTEIAAIEEMNLSQASRIAKLAYLDPKIIQASLRPGSKMALEHFIRGGGLPTEWIAQRARLGQHV
jgi:hypothetical protein